MQLTDLKTGDWVKLNDEGVEREGTVLRISLEEHEVCVDNGIQEFWYHPDQVSGLPVDENQLLRLGFTKMEAENGVKYGKDAFRLWAPTDFSAAETWYREDHRRFDRPLMVHELQNIHEQMTKMPLVS